MRPQARRGESLNAEQLTIFDLIKPDLPSKTLLRVDEVARFFDVSPKTVYNWCDLGLVRACNINGKTLRIFRESLIEMMEKRMKC